MVNDAQDDPGREVGPAVGPGIDWDDHAGRGLEIVTRLHELLDEDDARTAGRLVDEVLERMTLPDAVSSVLMPFLRNVGALALGDIPQARAAYQSALDLFRIRADLLAQ